MRSTFWSQCWSLRNISLVALTILAPVDAAPVAGLDSIIQAAKDSATKAFCSPYAITPDVWQSHDMSQFMASNATKDLASSIKDKGFMEALKSKLGPKYGESKITCTMDGDNCREGVYEQYCTDAPEWTLAVSAVSQYVRFLYSLEASFESAAGPLGNKFASFPSIFAPDNKTVINTAPNGAAIGSAAWSFASALIGLIPGLGLIGTEAKTLLGAATSIAAVGSTALSQSNSLKSSTMEDLEKKYDSFTAIAMGLGNVVSAVQDAKKIQLDAIFSEGKSIDDIDFVRKALDKGTFSGSHFPEAINKTHDGMTAALAAPAINLLWQWGGVVAVRFHKNDFNFRGVDYNPCDNDEVWRRGSEKYCDKDGYAYVFVKPKITDPKKWNYLNAADFQVPGIDKLGDYHLDIGTLATASFRNQAQHGPGSAGPAPDQLLKDILTESTTDVSMDKYVFANFLVCDFANIPAKSSYDDMHEMCHHWGGSYNTCIFFALLSQCNDAPDFTKPGDNSIRWPYGDGLWNDKMGTPDPDVVTVAW